MIDFKHKRRRSASPGFSTLRLGPGLTVDNSDIDAFLEALEKMLPDTRLKNVLKNGP